MNLISRALGRVRDSWQGLEANRPWSEHPKSQPDFFLHSSKYWVYQAPFNTFLATPDGGAPSSSVTDGASHRQDEVGVVFLAGLVFFFPKNHLSLIFWWEDDAFGEALH